MNTIDKRKAYRYIGPGNGKGGIHRITSLGGQVTTWSNDPKDGSPGFSWLGTMDDFRKQFEEVNDEP